MFEPPRCPNISCRYHRQPRVRFFLRHGHYVPGCRHYPVQRFRCRACRRTFSRQTFRADFLHKKPYLNASFLHLVTACVGQRQCARALRVARRTIEHRFRWLAEHATHFQANRLRARRLEGPFQLDEMETFEGNRYQPVSIAVLIHRSSFFLVAAEVAPLRRKGRLSALQRQRQTAWEALYGRRPSQSTAAVRQVLQQLHFLTDLRSRVILDSDHKPLYGAVGRGLFGRRFVWRRHSASARRDHANPLFPINHTQARLRHFLSRLRRRTWCVSKKRECLRQHLAIATLWSNFCRGITNRTHTTPAQAIGVASRPYRAEEVLGWRQDWAELSPPLTA
jgi:transposase-like protein